MARLSFSAKHQIAADVRKPACLFHGQLAQPYSNAQPYSILMFLILYCHLSLVDI